MQVYMENATRSHKQDRGIGIYCACKRLQIQIQRSSREALAHTYLLSSIALMTGEPSVIVVHYFSPFTAVLAILSALTIVRTYVIPARILTRYYSDLNLYGSRRQPSHHIHKELLSSPAGKGRVDETR